MQKVATPAAIELAMTGRLRKTILALCTDALSKAKRFKLGSLGQSTNLRLEVQILLYYYW